MNMKACSEREASEISFLSSLGRHAKGTRPARGDPAEGKATSWTDTSTTRGREGGRELTRRLRYQCMLTTDETRQSHDTNLFVQRARRGQP